MLFFQDDFVDFRPIFSGEKNASVRGNSNPVEHIGVRCAKRIREKPGAIDDCFHDSAPGIDDNNGIRGIDIGPDAAVNPLQFIEKTKGPAVDCDLQHPLLLEFTREKIQIRTAVGSDKRLAVSGKSPSLTGIGPGGAILKSLRVVDENHLVRPGQNEKLPVQHGGTLGEILVGKLAGNQSLAAVQIDYLKTRLAIEPGGLVEPVTMEKQALGVGLSAVGVFLKQRKV